jgi:hypothetical protein
MATFGGTQDQDTADILCGICESQHNIVVTGPTYVDIWWHVL